MYSSVQKIIGRFWESAPCNLDEIRIFGQTGSGNRNFWNRKWIQRKKLPIWVNRRPDISSRFRDTENFFATLRSRGAAILDFFEKQNYTCRLIFRALSNAVVRFRIGPIGAEKKLPKFSYLSAQVTWWWGVAVQKVQIGVGVTYSSTLCVFGVVGVVSTRRFAVQFPIERTWNRPIPTRNDRVMIENVKQYIVGERVSRFERITTGIYV